MGARDVHRTSLNARPADGVHGADGNVPVGLLVTAALTQAQRTTLLHRALPRRSVTLALRNAELVHQTEHTTGDLLANTPNFVKRLTSGIV